MSGQEIRRIAAITSMALAVVLVLALVGCSSAPTGSSTGGTSAPAPSTGGSATGTTVVMKNFAFDPTAPTAKAGETITFKNEDTVAHNVKINGQESGVMDPGKDWTVKIDKAGAYPFSCIIHPSMTGNLTVQ
jgi:plastocyanin